MRVSNSDAYQEDGVITVTWAYCHVQRSLLLLTLSLLTIPLMAKSWRVWRKIRTAETHKLHLWDSSARWSALRCMVSRNHRALASRAQTEEW